MLAISRELVHRLGECAHICNDSFASMLQGKDVEKMIKNIELCKECGTICTAAIDLVYKGSHFKTKQLELCIEACDTCASECEKHNTEHNRECAAACRACAKACRDFIGGHCSV